MLISDLLTNITQLLGNRSDVAALAPQAVADTVTELSDNYPFEGLRETGPVVALVPNQKSYAPEFFLQPGRAFNKALSFYLYLSGSTGAGYALKFRDMENLEVLYNIGTMPLYWSQLGEESLYLAPVAARTYSCYLRYQFKHPFSYPAQGTDPVLADPGRWRDIFEFGACERIALKLRMQDVADRYHAKIFGDPEFERSSGARGAPGLLARRTSQTEKNQSRTVRRISMVRG